MNLTRRDALRVGGLSLAGFLAACSVAGRRPNASATPTGLGEITGQLSIATWPFYIDVDQATGRHPTLEAFEESSGIEVSYDEVIDDGEAFFGSIRPELAAGQPTGFDLAVIPNWLVPRMIRLGYLAPLHLDAIPNIVNLLDPYKDPPYDPGNAHSITWQGGITGIGYDPERTGRRLTSFADLLDPDFRGKVGLFSDMLDTMSLALLSLGVDPLEASTRDAIRAAGVIADARTNGQVRGFYGNEYGEALVRGDLVASMAWSGDIFQLQADAPQLEFVVPDEGGILWTDDLVLLAGAEHPADAHVFINHYLDPAVARLVTEYVQYLTPVRGVAEAVATRAAETVDPDYDRFANSPLIFPTGGELERLSRYPTLEARQEREWNELFETARG